MMLRGSLLRVRCGGLLCLLLTMLGMLLQGCTAGHSPPVAASKAASRAPAATAARGRTPLRIVIDPGHGGESTGAVGVEKVLEKEITLRIALELATLIQKRLGYQVILTRDADKDIALTERTELANREQGTIFLSIHTNASEGHRRRGIEVYYLDNTDDEASIKLAERENGRPLNEADRDLSFIVSDVIQTAKMDDSIRMAHYVYEALLERLRKSYKGIKANGVMKAPFSVLVGAHMPAILVEVSYLDQHEEGRRLLTRDYQRAIAEGLYFGVRRFLQKYAAHG